MSAIVKLQAAMARTDKVNTDRENYASYVADRVEHGGWSSEDVAEYRAEVERIMKHGTNDEKAAASEFWAMKANEGGSERGINRRVRQSIAHERIAA